MTLLEGKVAVVTGAGRGIGRAHALELARHGASVVVNDLGGSVRGEGTGNDADLTVAIIKERGGKAVADGGDVSDPEQSAAMIDRAISEFGRLDILVNNAGIVRDAAIWNMDVADFGSHMPRTWTRMTLSKSATSRCTGASRARRASPSPAASSTRCPALA
jgi:NAD(P)-dependent dehydrogenase (short-subunit alcohol dehydrogenase family)